MPLAILTWLRVARLASTLWIPAFAGMTEVYKEDMLRRADRRRFYFDRLAELG